MIKYPQLEDRAWLDGQMRKKSIRKIASEIGCSYSAIVHAKNRLGIETASTGPKETMHVKVVREPRTPILKKYQRIPKEVLIELYINQKLSAQKVKDALGVNLKTLMRAFALHGIETRGRQSENKFLRDKNWLRKRYVEDQRSVSQIAQEIGASKGAVISVLHGAGIPMRSVSEGIRASRDFTGNKHPNWSGGLVPAGQNGRYLAGYAPYHPRASKRGYVMQHRLVVEASIGRYLEPHEIVHHKNGDTRDNRIENLELTTKKKHFQEHFDAVKFVDSVTEENAKLRAILEANGISVD